ncbi:RNA polymerase sigma factor [Leptospira sp. GIMC2001]|uniref:RNA polymerase sigma factor n=1 Tax=Leptospira sp. GIMC2001 TaxID=1513297 RepID=UPI00234BC9C6|nr:sigma-70 family RNA polymerase sigma factor [Leptospira sp. GIMC2001]WCL49629.1 sigma-70 family RNA polymerase sigma factor [Leptospira sp. GIMC2001]
METNRREETLLKATQGDINAFQELFSEFQGQLKSFLYRLTTDRNDAEDYTHETFIKAFEKLSTFRGESSLKTWVFQIATNLVYNELKRRKQWTADVSEKAKNIVLSNKAVYDSIVKVHNSSISASYEIKEHIDTCFTCISKNLIIEKQIVILLKDVYDFAIHDICSVLNKSEGSIKYLLQDSRKTMTDIFDNRCSLVNKNGVCHQCSELNGWFNPKQDQQESIVKLELVDKSSRLKKEQLYKLRTKLIKAIDPLRTKGNELQAILLKCNRMAMGEVKILFLLLPILEILYVLQV